MADYQDDDLMDALRELEEQRKVNSFLESEDIRLKSQIDTLMGELEGMNIAISSAERYIASYEEQRDRISENIEKLKLRKETFITEINSLHLAIKAAKEDKDSVIKLNEFLKEDLNEIIDEKSMVVKKVGAIQNGIDQISQDKERKLPNLKWYSTILKKIYQEFVEAQNRMEVSIMLKKR